MPTLEKIKNKKIKPTKTESLLGDDNSWDALVVSRINFVYSLKHALLFCVYVFCKELKVPESVIFEHFVSFGPSNVFYVWVHFMNTFRNFKCQNLSNPSYFRHLGILNEHFKCQNLFIKLTPCRFFHPEFPSK